MTRRLGKGRSKPPVESEAQIQRRIVDYLEAHGWFCFQNRSDGLGGKIAAFATTKQAGSPDLFCWKRLGRGKVTLGGYIITGEWEPLHFAIEVKRPGGKQSPAQIEWCGKFVATGHLYILAYSHEDVEKALKERGWL